MASFRNKPTSQLNQTTQLNNKKKFSRIVSECIHASGWNFHKCTKSSGRASTNRVRRKLKRGFKEIHNFRVSHFSRLFVYSPLEKFKTGFSKCSCVRNNWKTRTFSNFSHFFATFAHFEYFVKFNRETRFLVFMVSFRTFCNNQLQLNQTTQTTQPNNTKKGFLTNR